MRVTQTHAPVEQLIDMDRPHLGAAASKANAASASQLVPAVLKTMTLTLPWFINLRALPAFILIEIPDDLDDLFRRIGDLENIQILRIDVVGLQDGFTQPLISPCQYSPSKSTTGNFSMRWVWMSVILSKNSSSVPYPPGK